MVRPVPPVPPTYEKSCEKHGDIVFGKVDTEAEQALAGAAQITSIPTMMGFRDGILVFRQSGALPPAGLEQVIEGVRALDMDDVRRQVAAQQAAHPAGLTTRSPRPARPPGCRSFCVRGRVRIPAGVYSVGDDRPAGGTGHGARTPTRCRPSSSGCAAPRARSAAC